MYKVYCDEFLIYDTQIESLKLFNAKLDLELNKTGSFNFTIYPEHPYFDKFKKLKSIITVYQDNHLLFRGRILNDEQGFYNEKQVSCEGELAFLLDSIQRPYDFMSGDRHTTVPELFTFFINNHNLQVDAAHQFRVGNITVTDPNNYIVRADSTYMNTWDSINKKLIESLGGYLWIRHEADGNYIDYLADFNTISSQTIEFGKNLLDINKVTKGEDIATAIIPLGAKDEETGIRLGIEDVHGGLDYVYNQEAVDQYGWIFKTVIWDDVTVASNLLNKANQYLASVINLIVTIELDAFDLSVLNTDVNSFNLGTYIRVFTNPHSLNSNFLVKKLSIDLLNPKSNKLTLGTTYSTFTEQTNANSSTVDNTVLQVESVGAELSQTKTGFEQRFQDISQDIQDVVFSTNERFENIQDHIRFSDGNIIIGENGNGISFGEVSDDNNFNVALEAVFKKTLSISGLDSSAFARRTTFNSDGNNVLNVAIGNVKYSINDPHTYAILIKDANQNLYFGIGLYLNGNYQSLTKVAGTLEASQNEGTISPTGGTAPYEFSFLFFS